MKVTGIYKIESKLKPERVYTGSAVNMKQRWIRHLSDLKLNKHHSIKLQRHYNKYGQSDLIFIIIELCFPEFLTAREQYYINKLKPYFNICKIAGSSLGRNVSEETRKKLSESNKKPIIQFSKNMCFIKDWDCAVNAGKTLSINKGNINSCLTENRKTAGNFIWKYKLAVW